MPRNIDFVKIKSIKWAELGTDGAMGSPVAQHGLIVEDSFVSNTPAPSVNQRNVEEQDYAIFSVNGSVLMSFGLQLANTTLEDKQFFQGGTYTPAGAGQAEEYKPATSNSEVYKSVEVIFSNAKGEEVKVEYPKCKILSQETNAIGKNNPSALDLIVNVETPFDGSGAALPQFIMTGAPATS